MTTKNTDNKNVKNSIVTRCTIDSKSLLARLLATENIVVEHIPTADTAYFDTASRRLVLPVWKNMDEDTYDMLVGHEVGHAIYTPAGIEALRSAVDAIDPNNPDLAKGYLNIVEDARIERLMKRRYPGLAHNFRRAYTRMYDSDMFGFKRNSTDPSDLGLIDRLNLRAKVGVHADVDVPLDTTERMLFAEMMRTETWDDVVRLTKRIYDIARKPAKQQQPPPGSPVNVPPQDNGDDMMNDDEGSMSPTSEQSDPAPGTSSSSSTDTGNEQPQDSTSEQPDSVAGPGEGNTPEAPVTDRNHANLAERDRNTNEIVYVEIGGPEMLKKVLVDHRTVAADFANARVDARGYDDFRAESRNYVNMLVKEFELRKAADQHARTSISTSGVLDSDRLHQYKYVDDIFKRMATIREGKNHGMVMFLDWSSSMSAVMNNTVRQVMCLAWFCRACNIPFDVYAFGDRVTADGKNLFDTNNRDNPSVVLHNLRLFNFLSSRMTSREFTRAMQVLFTIGVQGTYGLNAPDQYHLNGTPLFATAVAARHIVDEFRRRNNLQIVNTVFLTDGDDTDALYTRGGKMMAREYGRAVVRDRETRAQVMMGYDDNVRVRMSRLLQLLKFTTGTNIVGVYLINGTNGKSQLASVLDMKRHSPEFDVVVTQFRNQKYVEANNLGYDAFFVVPGAELDTKLDEKHDYTKKDLTKGRIAGAFLKASQAKNVNRVLLQRFIGFISR